jgi:signal transduction histidine kinase
MFMKKFSNSRIHVFIGLVISITFTIVFDVLFANSYYAKFNAKEFEDEVNRQKIFLEASTIKMASQVAARPNEMWNVLNNKNSNGFDFLVYSDSALIGWSSQLIPIGNMKVKDFQKPFIKLANGWYLSVVKSQGKTRVIGLFAVKTEYSYENKYISNRFAPCFNLSNDVVISSVPVARGHIIHDTGRNILFSVIVPDIDKQAYGFGIASLVFLAVSLCCFFIGATHWLASFSNRKVLNWMVVMLLFFMGCLHVTLFSTGLYHSTTASGLFSPIYFAYSSWLSSIGSYLFAALFVAWLTYLYYRFYTWHDIPVKWVKWRFGYGVVCLLFFFWLVSYAVYILFEHSTDVYLFQRIVDLNTVAVLKLIAIFLLLLAFALYMDRFIGRYIHLLGWRFIIMVNVAACLLLVLVTAWKPMAIDWKSLLFYCVVVFFIAYKRQQTGFEYSYRHLLWLVLLFDIYAVLLVFRFNIEKEKDNRQFLIEILANNLAGEQDAVAEMYLTDSEKKIAIDPNVLDMIGNGAVYEEELRQYLLKNYFFGYLSRYEIQVVPCWPRAELYIDGANQTYDCYRYFDEMLKKFGEPVSGSSHFYFLRKGNGRVNYFGVFKYYTGQPGLETSVFVEFTSKPFFEGLGYPELLISEKEQIKLELLKDYSYAQYVDDHLVKRSGEYLYKVTNQQFVEDSGSEKYFVDQKGYSHLIYQAKPDTVIAMSYRAVTLSNVLMAFSVIYLIFLILLFLLVFISRIGKRNREITYSIQERIQFAMVSFSVVLMVAMGVSSVIYAVYQNRSKNYDMLSQRLKSVLLEMDQKIGSESKLTPDMVEYLNYLLQNFSNVFYSDINMYGLDGQLLSTSRTELYQKGVMGNLMNPEAFKALAVKGEREYIHNESIGELNYISAYVPFLNQRNEVLAYLNLPYFVGNNQLREEISAILVSMVNAYLVFILVAIGIALLASRKITRPLLVIQERLSQTRLGLKNEKIKYDQADEIGHLVDEYNRMVEELARSADKLAKSEREMAWREMAKQIAHEIKNPLTPMQLSVQYLQKAWDDKVPDFDSLIKRVSKTLIDQIRQLSVIANEFSHFAQMPAAKRERVDIIEKLVNTIDLYEKTGDATFHVNLNGLEHAFVYVDGEQILSVYNNLIKNGMQAVLPGVKGIISIEAKVVGRNVVLAFADNGRGIQPQVREKLFTPNFTTKSSGMGLGLSIVKNIIEGADGKIWFETEVGKGSTFYTSLPLSDETL